MNLRRTLAWVVPVIIFGVMALAITDTAPWDAEGTGLTAGAGQLDPIAEGLFTTHVFTFEVLGVLLTAAMIGALVIARPLGAPADSASYWSDPDHAEVEPEMHAPAPPPAAVAPTTTPPPTPPAVAPTAPTAGAPHAEEAP